MKLYAHSRDSFTNVWRDYFGEYHAINDIYGENFELKLLYVCPKHDRLNREQYIIVSFLVKERL